MSANPATTGAWIQMRVKVGSRAVGAAANVCGPVRVKPQVQVGKEDRLFETFGGKHMTLVSLDVVRVQVVSREQGNEAQEYQWRVTDQEVVLLGC